MHRHIDDLVLVANCRQGDPESLESLTHRIEPRLRTYIYRLTLDHDLTHDLLQETLLHLVKSINKLEHPEAFWPWLYRTALGKVQHHFREQGREAEAKRGLLPDATHPLPIDRADENDGLAATVRKELLEAVFEAMKKLSVRQRGVVVLRCFEQRSYAEIGTLMNCSEMAAQVLMHRAKCSLRRHLSRRGFKTGCWIIGLDLFGRRTALDEVASAAASIGRATLDVGLPAKAVATLGTPFGIGVGLVLATVASFVAGSGVTGQNPTPFLPSAGAVMDRNASLATTLAYPSRILSAHDPDGDGWKGIQANEFVSTPADPNEWLCGPPVSEQSSVVLPLGHWIELAFDSPLVDGPGDDVFVVEWGSNGERARVLVTDGRGQMQALGQIRTAPLGVQVPTESGFDLARIELSFVPRAIRIVSLGGGGGTNGFDLHRVRARVRTD